MLSRFKQSQFNPDLIWRVLRSLIWNKHDGRKKHKSASEVSGTGRKPFAQKHTGRARAGSLRSPIHRGGGKAFAATGIPKRKHKINKKAYTAALRDLLIYKEQAGQLNTISVDKFRSIVKTKDFLLEFTKVMDVNTSKRYLLILNDEEIQFMKRPSNNLHFITLSNASTLDMVQIYNSEQVLWTDNAFNIVSPLLNRYDKRSKSNY